MQSRATNKNSVNSGFLSILERYWLVILGLIFLIPVILRYLRDSQTKSQINDLQEIEKLLVANNENPFNQSQVLNTITVNPFYQNLARNIAIDLGTNIRVKDASFWNLINPKGWTENDAKVFNHLKSITNSGQRTTVVNCYYVLTRRNMMDDIKTLLDPQLLQQLPLFR